jgi:hypothetical protein
VFSLAVFIKKGLLDAVGKMADYWVILNATGWFEKSVLTEPDLAELNEAIDAKNAPPAEEIPPEEMTVL